MSTAPNDDLSTAAALASAAAEPERGEGPLAEERVQQQQQQQQQQHQQQQQQEQQQQDRLLLQLQLLQQQLGLGGHGSQSHFAAGMANADLATALDSLASAAASASVEPSRRLQLAQQEVGHGAAGAFQAAAPEGGSDSGLHMGEELTAEGDPQRSARSAAAATARGTGLVPYPSSPLATRQQHLSKDHGATAIPAATEIGEQGRPTQQQWKRARFHDAQAQPLPVAPHDPQQQHTQQQQQQYRQRQQLSSQAASDERPGSQQPAERVSDQRVRPDLLQQLLQQRLQQVVLPELGRQAILQSLDPSSQCLVECGSVTGIFSVDTERILCLCSSCSAGKGPPGPQFMPSEFERHGGMAACKKWRFSIKVADGGPGMTLGRWLDMRGLQISSYPAKTKHSAARSKRPPETGRGLMGGPSESGVQADLGQLLAGVTGGHSQFSSALTHLLTGTASSTSSGSAPAAAALVQALAEATAAEAGGSAAAAAAAEAGGPPAAGVGSRLTELAALVAQLLAMVAPASAAGAFSQLQQHSPAAAASGGRAGGLLTGPLVTGEQSANTLMLPAAAAAAGGGNDDVGYAVSTQAAPGTAGTAQQEPTLQHLLSLQRTPLTGPLAAGSRQQLIQQQLGMLLSAQPVGQTLWSTGLGSAPQHDSAEQQRQRQQQSGRPQALAQPVLQTDRAAHPDPAAGATEYLGQATQLTMAAGLAGSRPPNTGSLAAQQQISQQPGGGGFPQGPFGRLLTHTQLQQQQQQQQRQWSRPYEPTWQSLPLLPSVPYAGAGVDHSNPVAAAAGQLVAAASAAGGVEPDAAEWQSITSTLESRLELLLEDRRRRKQLEQQVAAQNTDLSQLRSQLDEERSRRVAAEQRLSSLSALLMQKLDEKPDELQEEEGRQQQPRQQQQQQQQQQLPQQHPTEATLRTAAAAATAGISTGSLILATAAVTAPMPPALAAEQQQTGHDNGGSNGQGQTPSVQEDPAAYNNPATVADDTQPEGSAAAGVVKLEQSAQAQ